MRVGRAAGYALVAMITIADRTNGAAEPNGAATARQIARESGVPVEYLRKILQRLTRARLVRSQRGRAGGFRLGRASNRITLLHVVEAIDGPVDDLAMLDDVALHAPHAALKNLRRWRHDAAGQLRDILKRTSLDDVLSQNGA